MAKLLPEFHSSFVIRHLHAMNKAKSSPLLILISAPSGAGKTTLCNQLLASRPDMARAITCTTRPPRTGEKNGVDYYFFRPAEFQRRERAGEFIEHATVYGNRYGILKSELLGKLRSGRDVLLNVDVQGAATIRGRAESEPELKRALVAVFLTPTHLAVLAERLKNARRIRRRSSASGSRWHARKSRSGKISIIS